MLQDDESLLSAYLDDELGRKEHEAVEASLSADARLSEALRGLAGVRDLLADLSRPAPADAAPEVMRRLGDRRAGFRPIRPVNRSVRWLAAGLAAAAVLGFLLLPAVLRREHRAGVDPTEQLAKADPGNTRVADRATLAPTRRPTADRVDSSSSATDGNVKRLHNQEGGRALRVIHTTATPDDQGKEIDRVRTLLDDSRLRRTFFVTDQIDQPALSHVATVVEQTTRQDYFKITIAQGIVIDPRHPDQATVFALVLDESELATLRARLHGAFKDRVGEDGVDPGVVAQLADIGQVASFAPHPIGDVVIPEEQLSAIREPDQPTPEQEHSRPIADRANSADAVNLAREEAAVSSEDTPVDNPVGDSSRPRGSFEPGKIAGAGPVQPARKPSEPPSRPEAMAHGAPQARRPVIVLVWVSHTRSG